MIKGKPLEFNLIIFNDYLYCRIFLATSNVVPQNVYFCSRCTSQHSSRHLL